MTTYELISNNNNNNNNNNLNYNDTNNINYTSAMIIQHAWKIYKFNIKYNSVKHKDKNIKHINTLTTNVIIYYEKANDIEVIPYSHFIGEINTTYDNIVNMFGNPSLFNEEIDGKVNAEWLISTIVFDINNKTYDNVKFSIYNWKTEKFPYGKYDWHIGGQNKKAIEVARYLFYI